MTPKHSARKKVLVQVLATSLNPVDYKIAELGVVGRLMIKKPSSPGLDFAGKVAATGTGGDEGVKNWAACVRPSRSANSVWHAG